MSTRTGPGKSFQAVNTLNYGADRVRYLSPVPAGSRIRGRKVVVARHDIKATISG
jgi:acyl dehydratase